MDNFDLIRFDELGDSFRTQNAECIADRYMKDTALRQEIKPVLPFARGTHGGENVMAARAQSTAQIDNMALAPAALACR